MTSLLVPAAGHGQIRIKIEACGICHSDARLPGIHGVTLGSGGADTRRARRRRCRSSALCGDYDLQRAPS